MGITYNKEYVGKDRKILPRGPRDLQLKRNTTSNSDLVTELKLQVERLQKQLLEKPTSGYTAEQVDVEILKALKTETASLKQKHTEEKSALILEIEKHKGEIKNLKELLKVKDEQIQQLKTNVPVADNKLTELLAEATKKIDEMSSRISTGSDERHVESDRPKMETVFVDPIENESEVEKYFEVEDVSTESKLKMESKVNKLKSLMGKLPSSKN